MCIRDSVNRQIVGAPFDPAAPNPVVHAQFNACYGFARALADGRVDIRSFTPEKIQARDATFAQRLRVSDADDIASTAIAPARIRLDLVDGTMITKSTEVMKGSPEAPMTRDEMLAKFRDCLAWGLDAPAGASQRLAELILNTDALADARILIAEFRSLRGS